MTDIILKGAKGGSSTFQQTPDNLRSDDTFEGVLGIAIGPLEGPERGLKSIKLDGTALENETGELNFGDFVATIGTGDPAAFPQPIQLKLGAGGAPTNIQTALTNANSTGPGSWVTRTLNNTNADFIDLRFIVNQLFRQDKNGVYNNTATLEINMKPVGSSTWINPTLNTPTATYNEQGISVPGYDGTPIRMYLPESYFDGYGTWRPQTSNYAITGKTGGSPSVYELRIGVPNTGAYANTGWDIRVRLIEKDSVDADPNFEKRSLSWESMAAVYSTILGTHEDWRGVAWLQLYGKASDQLTGVPEVTSVWKTKRVQVPPTDIFNPTTRAYTSAIWDGSWTKAYTNDPAWGINDAISDSLSGLSLIASGSYLNKWDALEASKWCSVQVPDGAGGYQPRYSLNLAISEPQKAEDFVRYLAGAIGGLAWDQGDGEWRLKIDKPEAPVDLFTLENIEGEFLWSNTDVDTRFNDITGTFKNAEMDYRQDRVRLFDNTSIALLGRKPTNLVLVGCTNRQEALRRIKLRLRSTVNEKRVVNFTTNRRGRNVNQLDTILIADRELAMRDRPTTGRMTLASTTVINFRDPIYIPSGVSYNLRYSIPNPNYNPEATSQPGADWTKPTIVKTVLLANDSRNFNQSVTTLYIDSSTPMAADIPAETTFAIEAPSLPAMPKLFRITNITRADDGERISISAIEVDTGKWDAADNVTNEDTVFQDISGQVLPPLPPTSGNVLSLSSGFAGGARTVNLVGNWQRPSSLWISGFRVRTRLNGGAWVTYTERTQENTVEIQNPELGIWDIEICSINRKGGLSLPLLGSVTVTQSFLNDLSNDVDAVQARIIAISSDSILAAGSEKQQIIIDQADNSAAVEALYQKYLSLGSPSDLTAVITVAISKRDALLTYLNNLDQSGTYPEWNVQTGDTPIDPAVWKVKWQEANEAEKNATAAISGRKGDNGAGTFTLVGDGPVVITPTSVTKPVADGDWTGSARSLEGFAGDVMVTGRIVSPSHQVMLGLNSDPTTNASYTSIDYAVFSDGSSDFVVYESAIGIATVGTITAGDFIYIRRRGTTIEYGVLGESAPRHITTGVSASTKLYLDSSLYAPAGASITNLSIQQVGTDGVSPPLLMLAGSRSSVKYTKDDAIASGPITFTTTRQNSTETPVFSVYGFDGTLLGNGPAAAYVASAPTQYSSTGVDNLTMTQATAANIVSGYGGGIKIVAGVTGSLATVSLPKIKDGADGTSPYAGFLTNESHTLPAATDGTITSYVGATGQFKVYFGSTDVTASFTFGIAPSGNPQTLLLDGTSAVISSSGVYTINGGFDAGEANASITLRATGTGIYAGAVIDKVFSLAKSKVGAAGANAKTIYVSSTHQTISIDSLGAVVPQTTTFTTTRQNPGTGRPQWRMLDADGTPRTGFDYAAGAASVLGGTSTGDDNLTLTAAQLNAHMNYTGTPGEIFEVRYDDATTITDRISIVRVFSGVNGTSPPVIKVTASPTVAHYNGADTYDGGNVTFTTTRQNTTTTPTFRLFALDGSEVYNNTAAGYVSAYPTQYTSSGPDNLVMLSAVVAYFSGSGGFIMQAEVGSVVDRVTVGKVKDGTNGTAGTSPSPKYPAQVISGTGYTYYSPVLPLAAGQTLLTSINLHVHNASAGYPEPQPGRVIMTTQYTLNDGASWTTLSSITSGVIASGAETDVYAGGSYTNSSGAAQTAKLRFYISEDGDGAGYLSYSNGYGQAS